MHDRQPVLDCDIEGADDFLGRQRIPGAALHARVVGVDDDLAAKPTGTVQKVDLTEEYKKHVLKFLLPKLRKLKIAIDASNGMAGKMVRGFSKDLA